MKPTSARAAGSMPRSLRTVGIFAVFLLVLIAVSEIKSEYPLRAFISGAVEHLLIVVTAVLVGAILLWIIEEAIEHHIAPAIQGGLHTLSSDVAREVRNFPEAWRNMSDTIGDIAKTIQTPGVQDLVNAGRIAEAVRRAKPEEEINVLLQSADHADWKKASTLLAEPKNQNARYFLTLAYRFWSTGKLDEAIRLSETGLRIAQERENDFIWKFRNSLAYYYADTADKKYEERAREYVSAARIAAPDRFEPVDTEGFVKITYGRTKEEVLEGVAISEKAHQLGGPFESYAKHIARARERLAVL